MMLSYHWPAIVFLCGFFTGYKYHSYKCPCIENTMEQPTDEATSDFSNASTSEQVSEIAVSSIKSDSTLPPVRIVLLSGDWNLCLSADQDILTRYLMKAAFFEELITFTIHDRKVGMFFEVAHKQPYRSHFKDFQGYLDTLTNALDGPYTSLTMAHHSNDTVGLLIHENSLSSVECQEDDIRNMTPSNGKIDEELARRFSSKHRIKKIQLETYNSCFEYSYKSTLSPHSNLVNIVYTCFLFFVVFILVVVQISSPAGKLEETAY
uniref:ER membrane protein complex subunit 10 n=2 Tax=Caenorhabditis tropicalis TaxID=1561998 RepID=A0A1I7U1Y9_9PELO